MKFDITASNAVHIPKGAPVQFYKRIGAALAAASITTSLALGVPSVMHYQNQKPIEANHAKIAMVQALRESFNAPECLSNARVACTVHFKTNDQESAKSIKTIAYDSRGNAAFLQIDNMIKQYPSHGLTGEQTITTPQGYTMTTNKSGKLTETIGPDGKSTRYDNDHTSYNAIMGVKG